MTTKRALTIGMLMAVSIAFVYGQINYSSMGNADYYVYNDSKDTLFLTPIHVGAFAPGKSIRIFDTLQIDGLGSKEIIFERHSAGETRGIKQASQTKAYPISLPQGSVLKQDLGFLGHHVPNVVIEMPFKKPRSGELSFSQKLYNKLLSSTRVVIEHAFSGVKRLRMLRDTIRIHTPQVRDCVMCVGVALHNLRVTMRAGASV